MRQCKVFINDVEAGLLQEQTTVNTSLRIFQIIAVRPFVSLCPSEAQHTQAVSSFPISTICFRRGRTDEHSRWFTTSTRMTISASSLPLPTQIPSVL